MTLFSIAEELSAEGITCHDVGLGSTPSCSQTSASMNSVGEKDHAQNLTEIHPGNYIFYDAQQVLLGSCQTEEIACRVLTTVIGHYPTRNQILVDCGFTGLTKQGKGKQGNNRMIAGVEGDDSIILTDMTQEIGFVESADSHKSIEFSKYPIGSQLKLIPYHSCATAACYPKYAIVKDGKVTDYWEPCKGW
eukprot:TRINITY_DN26550_c0_g1_i1.p1 TRINITY_DN26550_c0_g1~~TRINITY_DN26550_c0_g1_i1.p1  ORF type:complete len:191 (+),score=19.45 TRINITY_DN26550_c0_g1_i1:34-606(+)